VFIFSTPLHDFSGPAVSGAEANLGASSENEGSSKVSRLTTPELELGFDILGFVRRSSPTISICFLEEVGL
jgi:hypothetical protein